MKIIDLRSDTVTKPTAKMREAMSNAEVGDDVYLEDPTVNHLEKRAAEIFERQAALFVPTGSMGNLICVKLHTEPGQEVILESRSHILNYEVSSMAMVAGVLPRAIPTSNGLLEWKQIEQAIRPQIYYCSQTALICLENTHNMAGGAVMSKAQTYEICLQARERKIPIHLDGARVFNAAATLGESVADLTRHFDSVMFCLSKGLGAPVGSIIVGSREFIEKARILRKLLGGGMRQVGVLAAAGLIALEEMPNRLKEDHSNAKFLATALAAIDKIEIDPESVQSNILIFDISKTGLNTSEFSAKLKERGILANGINATQMRMLTHYDVDKEDCQKALKTIKDLVLN
ncbi:MAG: aminotransferase class I/II-fold pyridoxal phosphate-dependent enzyme [Acidobacteria bacterium]|nr:aminotransferase class I/II-fold pyridoxal phosphate-dependent enzyme [Acidobacteriota bacterium]